MTQRRHKVALIAGDGIGQEVVPAARTCVERVAGTHGFAVNWDELD